MEIRASSKAVRISTRKVRLVAAEIRNMPVDRALAVLSVTNKRGAHSLTKTIKSAVANAANNAKISTAGLVIERLEIDEGPFLKRFRPSTRGRVHPYKKRSSHITVVLRQKLETRSVLQVQDKKSKSEMKLENGSEQSQG